MAKSPACPATPPSTLSAFAATLQPVARRTSTLATAKLRPAKTWRPPRKQARSDPKRRIRSPLPPDPIPGWFGIGRKTCGQVGESRPALPPACPRRARPEAVLGPPGRALGNPAAPLATRHLPAMALTSVDYLEQRQKRTYKPEPSGLILAQPSRRSRPAITGACWYHGNTPCFNPGRMGDHSR